MAAAASLAACAALPAMDGVIAGLGAWPGVALSSHKSASQLFHHLAFVADSGVQLDHPRHGPGLEKVVTRILEQRDGEGIPTLPTKIPQAYGGTGDEGAAWALCDAPVTMAALLGLGVELHELRRGLDALVDHGLDRGWSCAVSASLGRWRGPGKKTDPCPYATLSMAKLLVRAQSRGATDLDGVIDGACTCLLDLWEQSRERHPFIFYMGTDFRKLKLPFVWYDILHVLDVLSHVPALHHDGRYQDMRAVVLAKESPEGWKAESVWQAWSAWDFGQKKQASPLLTAAIRTILERSPKIP